MLVWARISCWLLLSEEVGRIPFWLILHVHLAFGVVANVTDVYIGADVEL